jgi:hypothetical protein
MAVLRNLYDQFSAEAVVRMAPERLGDQVAQAFPACRQAFAPILPIVEPAIVKSNLFKQDPAADKFANQLIELGAIRKEAPSRRKGTKPRRVGRGDEFARQKGSLFVAKVRSKDRNKNSTIAWDYDATDAEAVEVTGSDQASGLRLTARLWHDGQTIQHILMVSGFPQTQFSRYLSMAAANARFPGPSSRSLG